jgi:hypothetical protein
MNTKKLIAAVAIFAAAGSSFAAEVTEGVWPAFTSTKTRAEVVAELQQAKADGSYALAHQQYQGQVPGADTQIASTKTRAEVVAELEAAQADGSYALAHQEYDGQFPQAAAQYAKAHGNANTAVAGRAVTNVRAN